MIDPVKKKLSKYEKAILCAVLFTAFWISVFLSLRVIEFFNQPPPLEACVVSTMHVGNFVEYDEKTYVINTVDHDSWAWGDELLIEMSEL